MAMEEGAKAVTGVVTALRAMPAVLAVLIFNLAFLALLTYAVMEGRANERSAWERSIELISKACGPVT